MLETTEYTPSTLRLIEKHQRELNAFADYTIYSILHLAAVPVAPEDVPAKPQPEGAQPGSEDGAPVQSAYATISQKVRDRARRELDQMLLTISDEVVCWKPARSLQERDAWHRAMLSVPNEKRAAWRIYDGRRMFVSPLLAADQAQIAVIRFLQQVPYLRYEQWADIPVLLTLPEEQLMGLSPPQLDEQMDSQNEDKMGSAQNTNETHLSVGSARCAPLAGFVVLPCDFTVEKARVYLEAFLPRIRREHEQRKYECQLAHELSLALARALRTGVSFTVVASEALDALSRLVDMTAHLPSFDWRDVRLLVVDQDDERLLGRDVQFSPADRGVYLSCKFHHRHLGPYLQELKQSHADLFDPVFRQTRASVVQMICRIPWFHKVSFHASLDGKGICQLTALSNLLQLSSSHPTFALSSSAPKPSSKASWHLIVHDQSVPSHSPYQIDWKKNKIWIPWNFQPSFFSFFHNIDQLENK